MKTLPYGSPLCTGATPDGRMLDLCRPCLRRTSPVVHAWQKWHEPPPAVRVGEQWECAEFVEPERLA